MGKLTNYQMNMLKAINAGSVMLRGRFDRYFWQESDQLCSAAARRLRSKGLIKNVYLNSVRDTVELTAAGRATIQATGEVQS